MFLRRSTTLWASILTASLLVATGGAFAQVGDLFGAAEATGGASGSYDVDASGAYDAAAHTSSDAHNEVGSQWSSANGSYEEARSDLRERSEVQAQPDVPTPDVPVGSVDEVEASHADRIEKGLDVETGLVDAEVDASAWGNVKAFVTGFADAAGNALGAIAGLFSVQLDAEDHVDHTIDDAFEADQELRSSVDGIVDSDADLPDLEPRISGDYGLEHAGEFTSDVTGQVQLP